MERPKNHRYASSGGGAGDRTARQRQLQISYQTTASVAEVPSRRQQDASVGGQLDDVVVDLSDITVNRLDPQRSRTAVGHGLVRKPAWRQQQQPPPPIKPPLS